MKVFDAESALFAILHEFILVRVRLRKASAKLNVIFVLMHGQKNIKLNVIYR